MNTTAPVPVHALTAENLRASPVWAYLLDAEGDEEIDESYVKPVAAPPPIGSYGSYLLSATYTLPGGEELPGAVQLDQLGTKRQFTPMLIHAAGKSLDPLAADVARQLSRLRKTPSGPPIRWTLAITLPDDNAPASGRIARSRWFQALALLAQLVSLFFTRRSR
jgi:hypothetical protein